MPVSVVDNAGNDAHVDAGLQEDDRWLLAKRIADSRSFAKSQRLSHLLLYLCEQYLLGRATELTEQKIASKVFERRERFDPTADTIVRSHVLRLRQKLDTYFGEEGAEQRLRITIPKGGYVPAFEDVHAIVVSEPVESLAASDSDHEQDSADLSQLRRTEKLLIATSILLGIVTVLFAAFLIAHLPPWLRTETREHSARHQLWKELFDPKSRTVLVAADSGLVMFHGATRQNSTLAEYLSRDFSNQLDTLPAPRREETLWIANRRYTSFVDLELFDRLTHLPEALSTNYSIRYARDISVDDLKSSNVILSGSQDANPWVEVFEPQMNFVLQDDLSRGIRAFSNRAPQPGEKDRYQSDEYEYGVLALLPNLNNSGNVLIVEGTSVAGTQAISDFLFSDGLLDSFLSKVTKQDGAIPHFEILLKSRNLSGSASRSQILAYRLH
jgi:DNA-binding winged helix-turn-helix (wHTH) protein